jgi:hypothetical protein
VSRRTRARETGAHTKRRVTEAEALLHNPDALEQLGEGREKELERAKEKDGDLKRAFGRKLTTREDVVNILAVYNNQTVVPMAHRLDEVEAFLALPPWVRWWRWLKSVFHRGTDDA